MSTYPGAIMRGGRPEKALAHLRACRHQGALMADIAATIHGPISAVEQAVWSLVRRGHAVSRKDPAQGSAHRRLRYFAAEFAPDAWTVPVPQPKATTPAPRRPRKPPELHQRPMSDWPKKTSATAAGVSRHRAVRLDPDAPAIVPRGVRITVCPCGTDTRFTVKPGERIQGAGFVDEWRRLRGARP